jgi:hypothetical protein
MGKFVFGTICHVGAVMLIVEINAYLLAAVGCRRKPGCKGIAFQ